MAAMVFSFGIKGSNGKAFSWAMRVSMIRKASETVNPIVARTMLASSFMCSSMRARTTALVVMTIPFEVWATL
jgi:hypothetical protein